MFKDAHVSGQADIRNQHVRTVLINLDRDTERLKTVSAEFARCGVEFERFSAIDGLAVPPASRHHFFDPDGLPAPALTKGEIGCYASHLAVWQSIAEGRHPGPTLICEDDIRLPENFVEIVSAALSRAPEGWDVIRLSSATWRTVWPVCKVADGYQLVCYSKTPVRLGAYLLSPQGAHKLLRPALRNRPVDHDLARPWELDLDQYGVYPPPVYQPTDNDSSIDAAEKRHHARRAIGFLGMPSRVFGPHRFARYWYNARKVGIYRVVAGEIENMCGRFWRRAASPAAR